MSLHRMQLRWLWTFVFLLAISLTALLGFGRFSSPAYAATARIIPGLPWSASDSKLVQAHGGGIIQVGSTYYWFGEDKTNGSAFQNVNCYSSTDLINWTFVNHVLTRQPSGDLGPNRVIERPKVLFNDSTHQYVMYMHVDSSDYATANVGVATSSSVCGSYSYRGSFRPLGFVSRDIGLFKDTDGTGYLLSEDRINGLRIDRLSSDYLSVVSSVAVLADFEAPALFKVNGLYYLLGSHLTGWDTNDNQYTTATSLSGPWSSWANFAPSGTHTYHSQTTFVLPVGNSFVYMGDRWISSDLADSTYVWLPLQVNGTSLSMTWHNSWSLNVSSGSWQDLGTVYYKIINRNSGKVLEVNGFSTADGAKIDQWSDNGGANQRWSFSYVNGSPSYKVANNNSGKVLDVSGFSTADGAKVEQWSDNGGTNQQWNLVSLSGGPFFKIVNRNSGKVLDVTSSSTADGATVTQWSDNGGSNQQWSLVPLS